MVYWAVLMILLVTIMRQVLLTMAAVLILKNTMIVMVTVSQKSIVQVNAAAQQ